MAGEYYSCVLSQISVVSVLRDLSMISSTSDTKRNVIPSGIRLSQAVPAKIGPECGSGLSGMYVSIRIYIIKISLSTKPLTARTTPTIARIFPFSFISLSLNIAMNSYYSWVRKGNELGFG